MSWILMCELFSSVCLSVMDGNTTHITCALTIVNSTPCFNCSNSQVCPSTALPWSVCLEYVKQHKLANTLDVGKEYLNCTAAERDLVSGTKDGEAPGAYLTDSSLTSPSFSLPNHTMYGPTTTASFHPTRSPDHPTTANNTGYYLTPAMFNSTSWPGNLSPSNYTSHASSTTMSPLPLEPSNLTHLPSHQKISRKGHDQSLMLTTDTRESLSPSSSNDTTTNSILLPAPGKTHQQNTGTFIPSYVSTLGIPTADDKHSTKPSDFSSTTPPAPPTTSSSTYDLTDNTILDKKISGNEIEEAKLILRNEERRRKALANEMSRFILMTKERRRQKSKAKVQAALEEKKKRNMKIRMNITETTSADAPSGDFVNASTTKSTLETRESVPVQQHHPQYKAHTNDLPNGESEVESWWRENTRCFFKTTVPVIAFVLGLLMCLLTCCFKPKRRCRPKCPDLKIVRTDRSTHDRQSDGNDRNRRREGNMREQMHTDEQNNQDQ